MNGDWPPLIASDGELVTPFFKGRVVVDDVQQDRFGWTVSFISLPDTNQEKQ